MNEQLDPGYELWQHKEGKDIVKVKFLRYYVLFQPVKTSVSDALFYIILVLTAADRTEFGWYKMHKSNFYSYFKPVPKLKKFF